MYCPKCQNTYTRTIDNRKNSNGSVVRRRRFCEKCNYRFTTFERTGEVPETNDKAIVKTIRKVLRYYSIKENTF